MKAFKHLSLVSLLAFSSSAFCMQQEPLPVQTQDGRVQTGGLQRENSQSVTEQNMKDLIQQLEHLKSEFGKVKIENTNANAKRDLEIKALKKEILQFFNTKNLILTSNQKNKFLLSKLQQSENHIQQLTQQSNDHIHQLNEHLLINITGNVADATRYLNYHNQLNNIVPFVVGGATLFLTTRTNIKALAKVVIPGAAAVAAWQFGPPVLNAQWLQTNETIKKHWPLALALAMTEKAAQDKAWLRIDNNFHTDHAAQLNIIDGQMTAFYTLVKDSNLSIQQKNYFKSLYPKNWVSWYNVGDNEFIPPQLS